MPIVLRPETEQRLIETARQEGEDVNVLADALLSDVLALRELMRGGDTEALDAAFDDFAAGRERPLGQYLAEQRAGRGLPDSWPSAASISEEEAGVASHRTP